MDLITDSVYRRYLSCLLEGDRTQCRGIVTELLEARPDVKELYTGLFQRSMYQVGELWEGHKISVAIEQALGNLISNAIEHSQPGDTVEIRTRRAAEFATVSVKDQGEGIAEEHLGRLFQPYACTGARKTAGERSTGLGLAIALRIIEEHGGTIGVESTVGAGSTFRISLPLAD
jgi:signal transduction histidine kinase